MRHPQRTPPVRPPLQWTLWGLKLPLLTRVDTQRPQELQAFLGKLEQRPQTWQDCVVWACGHWHQRFHSDIQRLLRHFPPDKVGGWHRRLMAQGTGLSLMDSASPGVCRWNAFLVTAQTVSPALGIQCQSCEWGSRRSCKRGSKSRGGPVSTMRSERAMWGAVDSHREAEVGRDPTPYT